MVWTGTPTSTAFAEDDRIIVRYYITNIGTMASGHTCTLTYNAADAATGDSFFQINEDVTFKAENLSGPVGMATETDTALALGSARPAGLSTETDTALALTARLIRLAGTSEETDTALALGAVLAKPVGVSTETDTALALGSARPAGIAEEVDLALSLSAVLSKSVGMAVEVDEAFALEAGAGTIIGTMDATESGSDSFEATGFVNVILATMAAQESGSDTFAARVRFNIKQRGQKKWRLFGSKRERYVQGN